LIVTYDQLIAFLAVANEGTFLAASARLHKSQPAVSKLVRNLEDDLGIELFDRHAYRATLTDAGRLLYERAASIIESTEELKSFAKTLAGKVEPVVRLAIEAVTPLGPIMEVCRSVQSCYPTVRIELATERLSGAADALREERADLIVATMVGMTAMQVETARFCSVRVVPVARVDHPVATCGVPIPPALLRAHAQIVLRDSAQGPTSPSLNVLKGGLRWSVTDVAAKKQVILGGMGWGGLPEHVVADALAAGELVALSVPEFEADTMELFVMRRRDRARGIVAQALWEGLLRRGPMAVPKGVRATDASRPEAKVGSAKGKRKRSSAKRT
jgi:DNA-binding transcriptional LysR family regulator